MRAGRPLTWGTAGVAITALVVLAACSSTTSNKGPTLTTQQVSNIGLVLSSDLEQSMLELGSPSASSYASIHASNAPGGVNFAPTGMGYSPASSCPAASSTVDSDNDGVPDSAVYSYTASNCKAQAGTDTLTTTGNLQLVDPKPTSAGFDANATLTDLSIALTGPEPGLPASITLNGTMSSAMSGNTITRTEQVTTLIAQGGQPNVTAAQAWSITFTPSGSGTLTPGQSVPPGNFGVSGSLSWSDGTNQYAFTLTTPTALQYDPSCGTSASQFQAGEVHATISGSSGGGYLRVVWSGCAQPTYAFVAAG